MHLATVSRHAGVLAALWAGLLGSTNATDQGPSILHTFALSRLDEKAAVELIRSACGDPSPNCIITPLPRRNPAPGGATPLHVNVTAPVGTLQRIQTLLSQRDGPQPTRRFRLTLVEASNDTLAPSKEPEPEFDDAFRAVQEILPFKHFRIMTTAMGGLGAEGGRYSINDIPGESGERFAILLEVAGALDAEERLFVRDFKVKRDDKALIDSQFFVELGRPLVVGTSAYPDRGHALFAVLTVSESFLPAGSGPTSREGAR